VTFGLDYSAAPPDLGCAKANGVGFVVRYLEPADDWKTFTAAEVARIKAAGLDLVACYEAKAADPLGGFPVGVAHAQGAVSDPNDVGIPTDRPIYFAGADFDASPAQLQGPISDYYRGIATVLPASRIGGYGGYKSIRYLFDNQLITWGWQTYGWSRVRLPDGTLGPVQWDARAHIRQYNNQQAFCGGTVDYNQSMSVDFGQWSKTVTTYPFGYGTTRLTWDQMMAKETVNKLHPEVVRRFRALTEHAASKGVSLGVGTGWRVQPDPPPEGFAAPGNSNHEGFPADGKTGGAVAIDTVPAASWDWMERNVAAYGLRTFRDVNNEPWHIQPAEIPASRNRRTEPWKLAVFDLPDQPPPPPPDPIPPEDDVVTEEDIKAIAAAVHQYQLGDVVKGEMRPAGDIMREGAFYAHQAANIVPVSDAGGGTVDVKALAVAVADELAKRLEG